MNILEQFYIQLFACNKELVPNKIQKNITQYSDLFTTCKKSLPHMIVTYLNTGYTTQ
jgi:hypothetical protein